MSFSKSPYKPIQRVTRGTIYGKKISLVEEGREDLGYTRRYVDFTLVTGTDFLWWKRHMTVTEVIEHGAPKEVAVA